MRPSYRSDIDGLRAVAILPVVAYHVGFGAVPGGFVGVDVFFVISGFLIGGIIQDEVARGRFSYGRFLERRVRRIFPAFFAMLAFVFLVTFANQLPNQLVAFDGSAIAALFSFSNIWFWLTSGYFTPEAGTQPLLHTWSLGVEEQFYLIFPLFLMVAARLSARYRNIAVVLLAIVSFALSLAAVGEHPAAAFFLAPFRAWELLIGAMLAMGIVPRIGSAWLRNGVGAIGLAMIGYAARFFTETTLFPGWAAMLPVLGAAMVIHAGSSGKNWAGRLLAAPPFVFVGLISYSLYLWHWPLIIFQNSYGLFFADASAHQLKLLLVAISLATATVSWAVIERPFRSREWISAPWVWRWAGLGAGAATVFATLTLSMGGFPSRFSADAVAMGRFLNYPTQDMFRSGACFIEPPATDRDFKDDVCLAKRDGRTSHLLIGDSHAAHLWSGLAASRPEEDVLQATAAGCKPVLDQSLGAATGCARLMARIFDQVVFRKYADEVWLAAKWNDADLPALEATLASLRRARIAVKLYGPMVQYDAPLPWLLVRAEQLRAPAFVEAHRHAILDELDRQMQAMAARNGADYVSLAAIICPNHACRTMATSTTPMLFDGGHLTREGSLFVARAQLKPTRSASAN